MPRFNGFLDCLRLIIPLRGRGGATNSINRIRAFSATVTASQIIRDPNGVPMSIEIDDSAVKKLEQVLKDDRNSFLRITVESGGCHGFQYRYRLDQRQNSDDVLFTKGSARVVVDTISLPFVAGSTLNYAQKIVGQYFQIVENPNSVGGCGCGVSFNFKPPAESFEGETNK